MAGMVGFCGSRDLPASSVDSALVSGVVGSVLAAIPHRDVAVGCAVGADALVVSSALALGASSRLRVFAAFGPVSPPWLATRAPCLCSRRFLFPILRPCEIPATEHRHLHQEAGNFVRWGRRGGQKTLDLYGRPYFSLLVRFRWGRVELRTLAEYRAGISNGSGSR